MACIAKRRNRYILDFYDCQGKRQRQTLKEGTTKKAAKEKRQKISCGKSKISFQRELIFLIRRSRYFPMLQKIGLNTKSRT